MNNPQSLHNPSINSLNSNTHDSGIKSRSKKHSEDFSLRSDMKISHNDVRELQTFPLHFLPDNNMSSNSKLGSSSNFSQKQLTKKILERIESEQNHLNILEEEKSGEYEEEGESESKSLKSLTEIEDDIVNTISNKHTSNPGHEDDSSDSKSNKSFDQPDNVLRKNVTFSKKISRAKTCDIKLEENRTFSNPKSKLELSCNNSSNDEMKKKLNAPERIYDILKNKHKEEEKGANKIIQNIAVMMMVNQFVRQIKLKSGHFGILGNRQLKIVNDLCNPNIPGAVGKENEHANILVRLIKRNQLIQKTLNKSNFFKKWTGFLYFYKNFKKFTLFF